MVDWALMLRILLTIISLPIILLFFGMILNWLITPVYDVLYNLLTQIEKK